MMLLQQFADWNQQAYNYLTSIGVLTVSLSEIYNIMILTCNGAVLIYKIMIIIVIYNGMMTICKEWYLYTVE